MISGAIAKNPNLWVNLSSPRINSNSNFLSFQDNIHHPKSPSPLQSSQPPRFRTKATLSDEAVISETLSDMSFYELLGISESGSFSEIKQAYKQLARKYHPDVSPPDRAEEYTKRFIAVQEAYETLSDPSTRALYDRDMARGLHLAFSSRKRFDEGMERDEWRNQWQSQVSGLKEKSMRKKKTSWAAQMRQKRFESEGTS